MSIQIIDGFQVNRSTPIDNRIVASGSIARNNIEYKYNGLRVFDIYDNTPYVWVNSTWQKENLSNISGSGITYYVPVFTNYGSIGSSIIYQNGSSIGIGLTSTSVDAMLDVAGPVKATFFIGDGKKITNISANNILTGNLTLNRLTNGTTGYVLVGGVTTPSYLSQNQLIVGTASSATQSYINSGDTSSNVRFIYFGDSTSGNASLKSNSSLKFKPSTSQLLIYDGSSSSPGIAFSSGVATTGIYKPTTDVLGISTGGVSRLTISNNGISHVDETFESISSYSPYIGTESETTKITISSVSYDRIIYFYTSSLSLGTLYYIVSGWFETTIYVGSNQIYSSFSGVTAETNFQQNHCFILPAGVVCLIKSRSSGLAFNIVSNPTMYAYSLRFGLNTA